MDFNNTTTLGGLIQECERICSKGTAGISGATNLLKDFTARINQALDRFFALAFIYDPSWHFDDANNTSDLPIGSTDLATTHQDYSFASELLVVMGISIKDPNGQRIDLVEDNTLLPTTNTGVPSKYRLVGGSILLDVIPSYNYVGGLTVVFKRGASRFIYTDTTKVPGIPLLFHDYLARHASLPYLIEKKLPQKNDIAALLEKDEASIKLFMTNRNKAKKGRMTAKQDSNK